jgi:spore coat polysaccharide biosynthesis protein SpsF (cytidylyltransferase family)
MKLNFNQQRMAIIIFARLNSRRLPKKVMSKVGSKPLLLFIIDRIKKNSNFKLPIIVATSKNKSDNEIEMFCKKNKIKIFRGELNDAFKRNLDCIKKFKLESFIRVCADRPFFDVKLMDKMIKKFLYSNFDIITNQYPRTYPKGLACEIAKTSIFLKNEKNIMLKRHREHIFEYFYENNKNYKIYNFRLVKNFKNLLKKDFSINNNNDLIKINKLYNKYIDQDYIDILKIL